MEDISISRFLENFKLVATSPYAFAAYIIVIIVWAILNFKSNRIKTVAGIIRNIPEKDRKSVLEKEYGFYLKEGMTAESFLKAQRNSYFFYTVIALLVTIIIITVIALLKPKDSVLDLTQNNFNKAMSTLVSEINNDFENIKGDFIEDEYYDDDTCKVFESKLKLPNSSYNEISLCHNDYPNFSCNFYHGEDKGTAFEKYTSFINSFKSFTQDWLIHPGLLDKEKTLTDYTSFIKGEKKLIVSIDKGDEADDSLTYYVQLQFHKITHKE